MTRKLLESEALALASEFIASETGRAQQCDASRYKAGSDPKWIFYFKIPLEEGELVRDPSHWIVEVDEKTCTAEFFYVM